MGNSHGYRSGTRYAFARKFRQSGMIRSSTYMHVYKVGDYVDIRANGAIHKGMPHKFYHGKTGVIFNVTKRAVGVIIHKAVRSRYIEKRVVVRIEHVQPSKCRQDFLERLQYNQVARAHYKATGEKVQLKRSPAQPRTGHYVSARSNVPVAIAAIPFEHLL
jgi:large subunit ribosomal protein L21e